MPGDSGWLFTLHEAGEGSGGAGRGQIAKDPEAIAAEVGAASVLLPSK